MEQVKTGYRVETMQLATVLRLQQALTLFIIMSWRVGWLMCLERVAPELEAVLMFDRDEWEAAFILNKKRPPKRPPKLQEVVRLVAMQGCFLGRKCDGEPGVKTI